MNLRWRHALGNEEVETTHGNLVEVEVDIHAPQAPQAPSFSTGDYVAATHANVTYMWAKSWNMTVKRMITTSHSWKRKLEVSTGLEKKMNYGLQKMMLFKK